MNAIQLLKEDHKKVRGLLSDLEATTKRASRKRTDLLASIAREIEIHTMIEEEIFYPAFKDAGEKSDDDKLYFEALEEHHAAGDLVLPDLQKTAPDSDQFGGRAKVLKELIEHHAQEEEREMFPRAKQLLSAAELRELGERMAQRKLELANSGKAMRAVKRAGTKLMGAMTEVIDVGDGPAEREGANGQRIPRGRGAGTSRGAGGARART